MTKNTVSYKMYEETKRHNLATENLQQAELDRKNRELLETIRNNMRNYGINLDKNQITRLANDQLNTREENKLVETIRSNLANEELKLKGHLETVRSNKEKERLEAELNEIKRMDSLLSNAKATGKDPRSMLISWFTNQANLQAFAGVSVPDVAIKSFTNWMNGIGESNSEATKQFLEEERMGSPTPQHYVGKGTRSRRGRVKEPGSQSGYFKPIPYETYRKYKERSNKRIEDEIPEDFSSSNGPSGDRRNYEDNFKTNENVPSSGNRAKSDTSEGYNSTPNKSENSGKSNVVYSGGAERSRSNSGPGVGIAFN